MSSNLTVVEPLSIISFSIISIIRGSRFRSCSGISSGGRAARESSRTGPARPAEASLSPCRRCRWEAGSSPARAGGTKPRPRAPPPRGAGGGSVTPLTLPSRMSLAYCAVADTKLLAAAAAGPAPPESSPLSSVSTPRRAPRRFFRRTTPLEGPVPLFPAMWASTRSIARPDLPLLPAPPCSAPPAREAAATGGAAEGCTVAALRASTARSSARRYRGTRSSLRNAKSGTSAAKASSAVASRRAAASSSSPAGTACLAGRGRALASSSVAHTASASCNVQVQTRR